MKKLFKAIDASLATNDTKWFDLYEEMDLSYIDKSKVVLYVKYHFIIHLDSKSDAMCQTTKFLHQVDKELIKKAVPCNPPEVDNMHRAIKEWTSDINSEFSIRNKRLNYRYVCKLK